VDEQAAGGLDLGQTGSRWHATLGEKIPPACMGLDGCA